MKIVSTHDREGLKVKLNATPDLPDEALLEDINLPTRIQNALSAMVFEP